MKKIVFTLLGLIVMMGAAFAQSRVVPNVRPLPYLKSVDQSIQDPGARPPALSVSPEVTTIYSEDFATGLPVGWLNWGFGFSNVTADPDTLGVWEYRGPSTTPSSASGSRGAYSGVTSVPPTNTPILSPTASNGFMIFDSDWLDDAGVAGAFGTGIFPAPHRGMLISPVLNLSQYPAINLEFYQYYRRFAGPGGSQTVPASYLLFSRNGGATWTDTIMLNSTTPVNSATVRNSTQRLNISSYLGGQSNARFAFLFNGDFYFWMVDDIAISTRPANDLQAVSTRMLPDTTLGRFVEYHIMNNDNKTSLRFQARVRNNGTAAQPNVRLNVTVRDTFNSVYFSGTSQVVPSLASGADTFLSVTTLYNPSLYAFTNVSFQAVSDSTEEFPTDNTLTRQFTLGDSAFSPSQTLPSAQAQIGTNMFTGAPPDIKLANYLEIVAADTITSVRAILHSTGNGATATSTTQAGASVVFSIQLSDTATGMPGGAGYILCESDVYTITAADVTNAFIQVPIPADLFGVAQQRGLQPGVYWLVCDMYSNNNTTRVRFRDDVSWNFQPWWVSMLYTTQWYSNGNALRFMANFGGSSTAPITCPSPTAATISNVTTSGATVNWTAGGTETTWQVGIVPNTQAGPPSGGVNVTSTTYNFTGLTPGTTYRAYVRAVCGPNSTSLWSQPVSFTTICVAGNPPYLESFDNTLANANPSQVPPCWSRQTNIVAWRVANSSTILSQNGSNMLATYFSSTEPKNDWAFSAPLNLTENVNYDVKFWVRAPGFGGVAEKFALKAGTSASVAGMTSTIFVDTTTIYNNWTQVTASFTPSATGVHYFGFYAYSVADLDYIAIDSFGVAAAAASSGSIAGTVRYGNTAQSPLSNVWVRAFNATTNAVVDSVLTPVGGAYSLTLAPGSYVINPATTRGTGGLNATDALFVSRHFTNLITLLGVYRTAADVNSSTTVNSSDALNISRRFASVITAFSRPWTFETPTVVVAPNAATAVELKGVSTGDVNGSWSSPGARIAPSISLERDGDLDLSAGRKVIVPIRVSESATLGAVSLALNFDPAQLNVTSIRMANPAVRATEVGNVLNGEARLAWYDVNGLSVRAGDVLAELEVELTGELAGGLNLQVIDNSELASVEGAVVPNARLWVPGLAGESKMGLRVYPNPAAEFSTVSFETPVAGQVTVRLTDVTGKVVRALDLGYRAAGRFAESLNLGDLNSGVYFAEVAVAGAELHSAMARIIRK
jgi:hypothetical protein